MAIFDYQCDACNKVEERLVMNSGRVVNCSSCGKPMRKLPPAPGNFVCKGTPGFYKPGANFKTKR